MAAPVLNLSEQKKALSGKIKKKKVIKNVLGLPTSVKFESPVVAKDEAEELIIILHRLLPSAKIPNIQNKNNEKEEVTVELENSIQQAKEKRKELSLGINDLNRSIKKNLISAAILAGDITPKFLVHHLNLLCAHSDVPFLHMPNLRKITQSCLGFPCVALGFRKNFNSFSEAVQKIRTIAEIKKPEMSPSKNDKSESEESDEEEPIENSNKISIKSECDIPFQFLYRSSCTERMFIPEIERGLRPLKKQEKDFISLGADTNENEEKIDSEMEGISDNLSRKHKSKVTQLEVINLKKGETSSSEEEYILPKKKPKKSWVIDKTGIKQNFKYSPANIIKVHSNPDRKKRKKQIPYKVSDF